MYTVIITTGAISISEMIKINHTLQVLNISLNPIGDEGIAAIARTLDNARISVLDVHYCNITVTGAKSLAAGLKINYTLKSLIVDSPLCSYTNDITVDGAVSILEAAVANGVCQEVIIYKYEGDDKMKKLTSILEQRKRPEVGKTGLICMVINIVMATKDVQPQEDTILVKKSQPSDHVS